jgi:CRP/FNR family transcriptional regulator, cyclic AMP receptor protein
MRSKARSAETWRLDDAIAGPLIRAACVGKRRVCKAGEYLYRQGETDSRFYFILRGHVQISSSREDGSEFVLEVMGHWAVCGEGPAFDGKRRFTSAICVEDSEVIVFDAKDMTDAFREFPELAVALLRITALKQRILAVRAQYLASPKPEARIAELLRRLADLYGTSDGPTTVIGITLTHEQMAAMTGTTRVTVTRVLKRLSEQGVIEVKGKQLRIVDLARLAL